MHGIKFEMMQVRESEMSLRKWSGGGTAYLRRILEGSFVAKGNSTIKCEDGGRFE